MANTPRSSGPITATFEFHRVPENLTMPDGTPVILTDLLERISRLSREQATYEASDGLLRLTGFQRNDSDCFATLRKIHPEDSVSVVNVHTEAEREVELDPDERTFNLISFYYVHKYRLLVLQQNVRVGGPTKLAAYIRNTSGCLMLAAFGWALAPSTEQQLNSIHEVRSVEVVVAPPTQPGLDDDVDGDIQTLLTVGRKFRSHTVSLDFRKGRSDDSLSVSVVKSFFGDLLKLPKSLLKLAKINGKFKRRVEMPVVEETEGQRRFKEIIVDDTLDLLKNKMRVKITISPRGKRVGREEYYQALVKAYNMKFPEIAYMYMEES